MKKNFNILNGTVSTVVLAVLSLSLMMSCNKDETPASADEFRIVICDENGDPMIGTKADGITRDLQMVWNPEARIKATLYKNGSPYTGTGVSWSAGGVAGYVFDNNLIKSTTAEITNNIVAKLEGSDDLIFTAVVEGITVTSASTPVHVTVKNYIEGVWLECRAYTSANGKAANHGFNRTSASSVPSYLNIPVTRGGDSDVEIYLSGAYNVNGTYHSITEKNGLKIYSDSFSETGKTVGEELLFEANYQDGDEETWSLIYGGVTLFSFDAHFVAW